MSYVNEFLSLRCAPDIMNAIWPIKNAEKEISESMGLIEKVKHLFLHKEPNTIIVYDMCAVNALTSVLMAYRFKCLQVVAADKLFRNRNWSNINNFAYLFKDIRLYLEFPLAIPKNSLILGVHACKSLSVDIINIYKQSNAKYLALMPCCSGQINSDIIPTYWHEKFSKTELWVLYLSTLLPGCKVYQDKRILSPRNLIIYHEKK